MTSKVDDAIVSCMRYLEKKNGKGWNAISRKAIRQVLEDRYRIKRCLRTIDYHKKRLVEEQYLFTEQRPKQKPDGTWYQLSNIYKVSQKAIYSLARTTYLYGKDLISTGLQLFASHKSLLQRKTYSDYPRFPAYILSDTERCDPLLFKAHSALLIDSLEGR